MLSSLRSMLTDNSLKSNIVVNVLTTYSQSIDTFSESIDQFIEEILSDCAKFSKEQETFFTLLRLKLSTIKTGQIANQEAVACSYLVALIRHQTQSASCYLRWSDYPSGGVALSALDEVVGNFVKQMQVLPYLCLGEMGDGGEVRGDGGAISAAELCHKLPVSADLLDAVSLLLQRLRCRPLTAGRAAMVCRQATLPLPCPPLEGAFFLAVVGALAPALGEGGSALHCRDVLTTLGHLLKMWVF